MGNNLRLLVVAFALLMAATAYGLWAAARTTDGAHRFKLQGDNTLVLPH
jgi:hypothetical protein